MPKYASHANDELLAGSCVSEPTAPKVPFAKTMALLKLGLFLKLVAKR